MRARLVEMVLVPAISLALAAPAFAADMVSLPGGSFTMGSDDGLGDERPAHRVTLPAFAIDRLSVTNAEFAAFLDAVGTRGKSGRHLFDWDDDDARIHQRQGRWRADPGYEQRPAVEMSWFGARDYCRAQGKRLPTEAEREYAARGAEGRLYPWGNEPPSRRRAHYGAGYGKTRPVGSLPDGATPEGVLDLAGNVHEWTASIALAYPYRADDGREDAEKVADRVTRGGAADTGPETLRASWRGDGLAPRHRRPSQYRFSLRAVRTRVTRRHAMKVEGACHCGYITIEAEADPDKTAICHCTDCQTGTGSAFRVSVLVPGATFKMSGEPAKYLKTTAESGNPRVQAFCPRCGSPIYSTSPGDGPQPSYMLRVGILRQRDQFMPKKQNWFRSALPWVTGLGTIHKNEKQA